MKKSIIVLAIVLLASGPLCAQEAGHSELDIWYSAPYVAAYQLDFKGPAGGNTDILRDVLPRLNIYGAVQTLFRLNQTLSIGPELGFGTAPIAMGVDVRNHSILQVALRAALHAELTEQIHLQALAGTKFNFWFGSDALYDMTFDVGARIELWGFLFDFTYALPFSVTFGNSGSYKPPGFWHNGLSIGVGGRLNI